MNADSDRQSILFEDKEESGLGKWIAAKELKTCDKVLLSNNECATIEEIQIENLAESETTYNFEVEDFHTYYVSKSKVLVHNKCPVNQMNKEIEKKTAPKEVAHVHNSKSSVPGSKIHVHFSDGTSLNIDGTIHEVSKGIPSITRETAKWLEKYGWVIPDKFRR